MALGTAGAGYLLGGLPPNIHAQAHSGDPGPLGTANVVPGVLRAQVRSVANPGTIAGAQWSMGGTASLLNVPAGTTLNFITLWDAASGGGYIDGGACTSRTFTATGTYLIDSIVLTVADGVAAQVISEARSDAAGSGEAVAAPVTAGGQVAEAGTQAEATVAQRTVPEAPAEAGAQKDATAGQVAATGALGEAGTGQDRVDDSKTGAPTTYTEAPAEAVTGPGAPGAAATAAEARAEAGTGPGAPGAAATAAEARAEAGTGPGAVADQRSVTEAQAGAGAAGEATASTRSATEARAEAAAGVAGVGSTGAVDSVAADTTAPVAGTLTVPNGTAGTAVTTINPGTCTDAVGITGWAILDQAADSGWPATLSALTTAGATWHTIASTTSWAPGATLSYTPATAGSPRYFKLYLRDAAGNLTASATASATVAAPSDTTAPDFTAGLSVSGGTAGGTFSATIHDAVGVTKWLLVEGAGDPGAADPGQPGATTVDSTTSLALSSQAFTSTATTTGSRYFRLHAWDNAGNHAVSAAVGPITITVPTTAYVKAFATSGTLVAAANDVVVVFNVGVVSGKALVLGQPGTRWWRSAGETVSVSGPTAILGNIATGRAFSAPAAYQINHTYAAGEKVTSGGNDYVCTVGGTVGAINAPPTTQVDDYSLYGVHWSWIGVNCPFEAAVTSGYNLTTTGADALLLWDTFVTYRDLNGEASAGLGGITGSTPNTLYAFVNSDPMDGGLGRVAWGTKAVAGVVTSPNCGDWVSGGDEFQATGGSSIFCSVRSV